MTKVALLVTGKLEALGLAECLGRVFPQAEFHVDMRLDGFTTSRVRNLGATRVPGLVDKLAAALVAAVDPGRDARRSDLAVAIDDLEVANLDQPEVVVEAFRDAVARHLYARWPSSARREAAAERVRGRASFHVLAPMTEAYFFGADDTLRAASVTAIPDLAPGVDLEAFTVVDAPFLAAPVDSAEWARPDRARHPKRYLKYLTGSAYRETQEGLAALKALDARALVQRSTNQLLFLRALLADIADGVDDNSLAFVDPCHPATRLGARVLRNA